MKANPTREELIAIARKGGRLIPAWAAELADKIEAAPNEKVALIWEERLAGALGYA